MIVATQEVPLPPMPPVIAPGGMPEEAMIAMFATIAVIVAGIVLYPLARALARRLEGGSAETRADLDQLHDRIERLEQVEGRLAELESRVEFSERLLAQQRALPERSAD